MMFTKKMVWGLVFFSCFFSISCKPKTKKEEPKSAFQRNKQPKPVYTRAIQKGLIVDTVAGTATLKAEEKVQILAQVAGKAWKVYGEEGKTFRKGAVLAKLSNPYLYIAYQRAQLQIQKLEKDLKKNKPLAKRGFVSKDSIAELSFQLATAQNELKKAQEDIHNLTIRSTIQGVVTQQLIRVGAWVNTNQAAFSVEDPASLVLLLSVPEKYLSKLQKGLQAELTAEALGANNTFSAKVSSIAPVIDEKTGTIQVTLSQFSNAKHLKAGMFVSIRLILEKHSDAVLIPKKSVNYAQSLPFVFVLDEASCKEKVCGIQKIFFKKGLENENFIEATDGLKKGQRVISLGQEGLQLDSKVRIIRSE